MSCVDGAAATREAVATKSAQVRLHRVLQTMSRNRELTAREGASCPRHVQQLSESAASTALRKLRRCLTVHARHVEPEPKIHSKPKSPVPERCAATLRERCCDGCARSSAVPQRCHCSSPESAASQERLTDVFLLAYKVQERSVSAAASFFSWLRGESAALETCHWQVKFLYPDKTVQYVDFVKDKFGRLLATSSWVSAANSAEYEAHSVNEKHLGKFAFTHVKVANCLHKKYDLGAYNAVERNCQWGALSLLEDLGVPSSDLTTGERLRRSRPLRN
ncbi:hypothetical protein MTO96_007239 [Rhipicephalus appendiculatus]